MPHIARKACIMLLVALIWFSVLSIYEFLNPVNFLGHAMWDARLLVAPGFAGLFLVLVWNGFGWARFAMLILFASAFASAVALPSFMLGIREMQMLLIATIELAAVAMLFGAASRAWFSARGTARKGIRANPFVWAFGIVFGIPYFLDVIRPAFSLMEVRHGNTQIVTDLYLRTLSYYYAPPAMITGSDHFVTSNGIRPADWFGGAITLIFYVALAWASGFWIRRLQRTKS